MLTGYKLKLLYQIGKLVTKKKTIEELKLIPATDNTLTLFRMATPKKTLKPKQRYTGSVEALKPKNKSEKNMAANGIRNAAFLSGKKAPPNKAIAATGVKLGKCGKKRENAATSMAVDVKINLGLKKFDFIFFN